MKRKALIINLISLSLFSIMIVFMLYLYYPDHQNTRDNSFSRQFTTNPIILSKSLDVGYNSYYIAGVTSNNFYFGNLTSPLHLLLTDKSLTDTMHRRLSIEDLKKMNFKSTYNIHVTIDSPYFYITDGTIPAIFRGSITDWYASRFMYNSAFFTELIPMNSTSFAIRTLRPSKNTQEYVLGKEMNSTPYVKLAPDLLEKQIDGIFCTDGMLNYSSDLNWLVYVYFYRNQFICIDSSLNLIYRGNTIDTVSRAQISVAEIGSDNSFKLAAPPLMVNQYSCVSGDRLFIHSKLLSKNENRQMFNNASVIDVYSLKEGKYEFSFYIPNYEKNKMREFRIFGHILVSLHDNYILTYYLNANDFHSGTTK